MIPPRIHATKTKATEPTARAISLVTRKTPVPIVSPMTMAVADHTPRPRTSSDESCRFCAAESLEVMEEQRAYYPASTRSIGANPRRTDTFVQPESKASVQPQHGPAATQHALAAAKSALSSEPQWPHKKC